MENIIEFQKDDRVLTVRRKNYDLVEVELEQATLNKTSRYSVVADMSLQTLVAAFTYANLRAYQRVPTLELVHLNGRTVSLLTEEAHRRGNLIMLLLELAGEGSVTKTWLVLEQSELVSILSEIMQAVRLPRPPRVN